MRNYNANGLNAKEIETLLETIPHSQYVGHNGTSVLMVVENAV